MNKYDFLFIGFVACCFLYSLARLLFYIVMSFLEM